MPSVVSPPARSRSISASQSAFTARRPVGPRGRRDPVAQGVVELDQHLARVADHRLGAVLDRVEAGGVDGDDPHVAGEAGPRRGGEVLQPGPDREHHVGLAGERVGRGRADDAERAAVQAGGRAAPGCGRRRSRRPVRRAPPRTRPPRRRHPSSAPRRRAPAAAARRRGSRPPQPASASRSARGRGTRCTRGSKNASGKSHSSACTSCGSASVTGPASAGSVSTRATCGSVASSCSGRVIRSK